jgi:hypothetical protein
MTTFGICELGEEDTWPRTVCANCLAVAGETSHRYGELVTIVVTFDEASGRRLCQECEPNPTTTDEGPTVPAEVTELAAAAIDAKRAWLAAPTDHDHHIRHAAATAYDVTERRLTAAVVRWVAQEAAR